jgi:hypothetical protein
MRQFFGCRKKKDNLLAERNKKVKAAEIPPRNRDRIACRHCPPRALWLLIPENFRTHFSDDAEKKKKEK